VTGRTTATSPTKAPAIARRLGDPARLAQVLIVSWALLRRSTTGDTAHATQLAALALDAARRHRFGTIRRRAAALV
jgi:hypothetical protein